MNNSFGNPYALTSVTVDGQKFLITNEDYRWLIEKLRAIDQQYQTQSDQTQWYHLPIETTTYSENKKKIKLGKKMIKEFLKEKP